MDSRVARIVDSARGGFFALMTVTYFPDEVSGDPDGRHYPDLALLRDMLIEKKSAIGIDRQWLDEQKWSDLLQDPEKWSEFEVLLRALENYDFPLWRAIEECELGPDDFEDDEAKALFREFMDPDEDYGGGIDGLIEASRKLPRQDASKTKPEEEKPPIVDEEMPKDNNKKRPRADDSPSGAPRARIK